MSKEIALTESLHSLQSRSVNNWIEPHIAVEPDNTISKIVGIMTDHSAYEVFIPLADKIACLNVRDLLDVRDITSTKPSILGKIVPVLSSDDTIGHAARIMSYYRLRALPIADKHKRLVGQVSAKSLVKSIHDSLDGTTSAKLKGSSIMTSDPIVIAESDKISAARSLMVRRRFDHLPVTEKNGELFGMLTSSQILGLMLQSEKIGRKSLGVEKLNRQNMEVSGVADRGIIVSNPDDSLHSVTGTILDADSTYSLMTTGKQIKGIVTLRDIISLLAEKVTEDLPAFIIGLPDDPADAELAKSKFANTIRYLKKIEPEIEEARCKIKLANLKGKRRRYELDVNIITPYDRHTYVDSGWDLPRLFDEMSDSLKKKFSHKASRRKIESARKGLQRG